MSADTTRDAATAEQLHEALVATDGDEWERDWPYIAGDIDVIDGDLMPVLRWLVKHYEIRPRS